MKVLLGSLLCYVLFQFHYVFFFSYLFLFAGFIVWLCVYKRSKSTIDEQDKFEVNSLRQNNISPEVAFNHFIITNAPLKQIK